MSKNKKINSKFLNDEAIKKIRWMMDETKLTIAFTELHNKYGRYDPIYTLGNVIYVTKWREGKLFKDIIKTLPEFDTFPDSFFDCNWVTLVTWALTKNQNMS